MKINESKLAIGEQIRDYLEQRSYTYQKLFCKYLTKDYTHNPNSVELQYCQSLHKLDSDEDVDVRTLELFKAQKGKRACNDCTRELSRLYKQASQLT